MYVSCIWYSLLSRPTNAQHTYKQYFIYRKYLSSLPEDDANASKNVRVLTIYIYIYIYCAFVGLDNKLYQMHDTYIKIKYI